MSWNYKQPVTIHFGAGIISHISDFISADTSKRGLIVTSPSFMKRGTVERIKSLCDGRICAVYADVSPNPDVIQIDECASLVRKEKCDFIIALGGGSVIDCAKVVSVLASNNISATELVNRTVDIPTQHLPLIAVPTTAGTGSEVTSVAVVSDHAQGIKIPLSSDSFYPAVAVVDPELTYSASAYLTACCGIDALCHAIEAYWSRHHQPVCDALALKAASMILDNIEEATNVVENKTARDKMSAASLIAGLAFAMPKTSSAHACSYPLTNMLGIPHGEACGLTIDYWIRFNYSRGDDRVVALSQSLGFKSPDELADRIGEIKRAIGLRDTLVDFDLSHDAQRKLIHSCMHPNMLNNPIEVTKHDVAELISALLPV